MLLDRVPQLAHGFVRLAQSGRVGAARVDPALGLIVEGLQKVKPGAPAKVAAVAPAAPGAAAATAATPAAKSAH